MILNIQMSKSSLPQQVCGRAPRTAETRTRKQEAALRHDITSLSVTPARLRIFIHRFLHKYLTSFSIPRIKTVPACEDNVHEGTIYGTRRAVEICWGPAASVSLFSDILSLISVLTGAQSLLVLEKT